MSGGIAYAYNPTGDFKNKCNMEMVELSAPEKEDAAAIYELLRNHFKYTQSLAAKKILDNFKSEMNNFIKVMPLEYKRILEAKKAEEKAGLGESSDG